MAKDKDKRPSETPTHEPTKEEVQQAQQRMNEARDKPAPQAIEVTRND